MPLKYGIQASFSFQSLPGYRFGTAALNIDTGIVAGRGQHGEDVKHPPVLQAPSHLRRTGPGRVT